VSKLYNTLEKIRTGEQDGLFKKKSASTKGVSPDANKGGKRRIVLLGAPVILILVLFVFFAWPKRKEATPPVLAPAVTANAVATDAAAPIAAPGHPTKPAPRTDASQKLPPAPPVALAAPQIGPGGSDLYQQLNEKGLALIQDNQYWRGIYYLEQARKQQPERPEALINMAVALAELGLRAPAKRLFSEAHALAPNHPLLRKNLELLEQADFFDPQWLASLTAGQIKPGQTTQPQ